MFRRLTASLILGIAVTALTVRAEPVPAAQAPSATPSSAVDTKNLLEKQKYLVRQYKSVAEDLLSLAHRLEKSSRIEDQDKAKLIRKAIELGDKEGIDNKFQTLLRTLSGKNGTVGSSDLGSAKNQNEDLLKVLKEIYAILTQDDEMARIREEKARLEKMLAELKGIIRETKVGRAITESGKGDKKKLAENQGNTAKKTDDLAKRMEGKEPSKGNESKGKDGMGKEGMGKSGMGKDGMGGMGKDGMAKEGKDGQSPPSPQGPKAPGADQVKKAVPDQEDATKKIQDEKRPEAIEKQTSAIQKLEDAQKELEKRLKQLREEELERLLANLEARVAKMLQMQIEVYEATKSISSLVEKTELKKPEKSEIQKSQLQADKESEIIAEANKTIEILKSEGSAVAFPRIFEEVVIDMTRVRERLNKANVSSDTQAMETEIITTLKEMLEALKKAQQELKQQGAGAGGGGGPQDQKLLDEIAELKMLRNLQVNVNSRTKRYGKGETEQVDDPQIKSELKDVANRQIKIEEMARDIATGKNK